MRTFYRKTINVLVSILFGASLVLQAGMVSAEFDDSSLFMEAFTAFQGKDYLYSIEKLNRMSQLFPESPLRDVSLLMLARAQHRSGDNEAAAVTVNQFSNEFGSGPLANSVEEELLALAKKQKAGEKLLPNKLLRASALKIRNDQLAMERAAVLKAEQERQARERAERERVAREKAETERRERERLAAIKAARDAVKFELETSGIMQTLETGTLAQVPFYLVNNSRDTEEIYLEALLPSGVDGIITLLSDRTQPLQKIQLQPRQRVELIISFKMPSDKVDGSRMAISARAISVKYNDIVKTKEIVVAATAPLVRVVSRLQHSTPAAGETLAYKVTLLNVGSRPAREVDMKISLPAQLKLVDAGGKGCWIETEQLAACRIDTLQHGTLTERNLKVMVRNDAVGKTAKGSVDILQTVLQIKESFPGAVFTVKK